MNVVGWIRKLHVTNRADKAASAASDEARTDPTSWGSSTHPPNTANAQKIIYLEVIQFNIPTLSVSGPA